MYASTKNYVHFSLHSIFSKRPLVIEALNDEVVEVLDDEFELL